MTLATSVEALLSADTALSSLLTGGIYTYQEIGRLGINRDALSAAFDNTTKKLKPCAVVKQRSRMPTRFIKDAPAQRTSEAAVIEIYLYSDGSASPPETAASRVYTLLHEQFIVSGRLKWIATQEDFRDPTLDYANVIRHDFEYVGVRN